MYRRPSFVVTSSINDLSNNGFTHEGNKSLKPPDFTINLTPPSPAPSNSFLKAPTFLKVKNTYTSNYTGTLIHHEAQ